MKTYSLTQTSLMTDVASFNLRFYEKEGLLQDIQRDSRNRRIYTDRDIEMINLIKCFRNLGMGIDDIKKQLTENKSVYSIDTKSILEYQKNFLMERRRFINKTLKEINEKLENID